MATSSIATSLVLARQLAQVRTLMPSKSAFRRIGLIGAATPDADPMSPIVDISLDPNVKAVPVQKGATATIPFMNHLKTQGKMDGATLEGNEEKITTSGSTVTLYQYDNAVKLNGRFDEQKAAFELSRQYKARLTPWLANVHDWEIMRRVRPSTLTHAAMTDGGGIVIYPNDITSVDNLGATDRFSIAMLRKCQAVIAARGFAPVRYANGRSASAVLLITAEQWHDLQTYDEDWKNGNYHAMPRGADNPFFSISEAEWVGSWSGIDVWCPRWDEFVGDPDAPANIAVQGGSMLKQDRSGQFVKASAMLLAASGAAFWQPQAPWSSMSDSTNYQNSPGWGLGCFYGANRCVIDKRTAGDVENLQNLGLAHVVTAASKLVD